jgi:ferredoxin
MAMFIDETCIACGACEPECPTKAITEGDDIFVIDANLCVECIGHYDSPRCVEVCPVECIHKVE